MKFYLLKLDGVPIFEQLQIEEALLRADDRNWCILNTNAPPAIVMGISGKVENLLHVDPIISDQIPVIKRFSGGGTVYIDQNTLFATFICNAKESGVMPFPQEILKWSETIYRPLFPHFSLRENDYVFGEKKFGGNAQYIRKERWLHHTSFLWDFDEHKMERYLKLPEKRPTYRGERSHAAFLCRLKEHLDDKSTFIQKLSAAFEKVEKDHLKLSQSHRVSTSYLSLDQNKHHFQ